MDNVDNAIPQNRVTQITYWQADGVQRLLTASAHYFIGLMEDDRTVLKYQVHKNLDSLISLREEADRYARVGTHGNLVACDGLNPDSYCSSTVNREICFIGSKGLSV